MENETGNQVEAIFHATRERKPGPERQAYLDGACGQDPDLRARVEALLAADDEAGAFLEGPAIESPHEGPGTSIGPYKLLQQIGEGGMGVVYMAEQETPVRRMVALKVIKLGMDTKQVIARFEAERQALAMMDHANIARVLDAGATESGRPFFVMELVRGVPINEYCDTHKLTTAERLALFVAVCRAVQHAHQKGIIHRDIKPTNVLVTSHDGTPVPKIIDFGVAKATSQRLTERTLFTEFHQVIGTPEYMSPEQAEMSGLDVDTRSDIYALGVLLYQLLTGTTPFASKDLRNAAYEEMTRMIREQEPPPPSTRISKLGDDGKSIAEHRGSDTSSLSRYFRGDLDWIVMKALEKDRTRRYETASAFAEDLLRHIESRPVEAGPPGTLYRLGKFVKRNRKSVAAALVLFFVFALGLAGTTAGFLRATKEAAHSQRVSDTLQDVLARFDARFSDQDEFETLLAEVRTVFGENHATYAAVLDSLAQHLYDVGNFERAIELSRDSLAAGEQVYGPTHPSLASALTRLGGLLRFQGKDAEAEEVLRKALSILEAAGEPGYAGHEARLELSGILGKRGDYEEADGLLDKSLAILRAHPEPLHFRIIETLERRMVQELNQASVDVSVTAFELYKEARLFYPEDSPVLGVTALMYGRRLFDRGEHDRALPYLREALRRFKACPEPPQYYMVAAGDTLFQVLRNRTDPEEMTEADRVLRDTIDGARSIWGPETLAFNLVYYAGRMHDRERHGEALECMLEAHALLQDVTVPARERESLRDKMTMLAFETVLRSDLAPEIYDGALEVVERAIQEEPRHPAMIFTLSATLYRLGQTELALDTIATLASWLERSPGNLAKRMAPADHAFRALIHARLGQEKEALDAYDLFRARVSGDNASPLAREVRSAVLPFFSTTPSRTPSTIPSSQEPPARDER